MVTARLRWRLRDGELKLGFRLDRLDKVKDAAYSLIRDRLATEFPDAVFNGSPALTLTRGRASDG